ncbi:MAG TPA: hypothetical protein VKD47_02355 [Miltoncostaeaceae bacterium]|nr:hypothetical protein [Miltoncostaeaceae bacterium]
MVPSHDRPDRRRETERSYARRGPEPAPPDGDDEPVETPLDEREPEPEDLSAIPMGPRPDPAAADEEQKDLDGPGMVYEDGRAEPRVGEDDDPPPDDYRPL